VPPRLFFSDLDSGPNQGGENGQGAFVTLYGRNFGASRGSSTVTFGGGAVASYRSWSDTKITVQLGPAAATGEIRVTTSQGTVGGVQFTVRSGNIYFVATNGNDGAGGSFDSPWRTVQKAVDTIAAGDIAYIMNGIAESRPGSSDGSIRLNRNNGASGAPKALVGYPGAVATLGAVASSPCSNTECVEGVKASFASDWWTMAGLRLVGNNVGLVLRGNNWRVIGNEFTCPWGNGASACFDTVSATYVKFYGNNVHDVGYDRSSALYHGIYLSTDSNHIDVGWNTITNVKGCRGIQVHSSPTSNARTDGFNQYGISIHDNIIGDTQCDGIVLATIDPSKAPILVYNNVIYRAGKGPATPEQGGNFACIYAASTTNAGSPGTGTVEVFNNTMYDCGAYVGPNGKGGVVMGSQNNLRMRLRNNIIYQKPGQVYWLLFQDGRQCDTCGGIFGENNIFFGNGAPINNTNLAGSHNLDPQFRSIAGLDFRLQANSPGRAAGVSTGLLTDIEGNPRGARSDLGAYQFDDGTPPAPPGSISVSPGSLDATTTLGRSPSPQTLTILHSEGSAVSWSAAADQSWISLSPSSGSVASGASVAVTVSFNTIGLSAGTYGGSITLTGGESPRMITVRVTVNQASGAEPTITAVVNGGSYLVVPVSPSAIVTIFGANLGPPTGVGIRLSADGRFVTREAAGTRVLFDEIPAALIFTRADQINAVVPQSVAGKSVVAVTIEVQGVRSNPIVMPVAPTSPAIFTADATGRGQGAIVNQSGTVNSASDPAPRGSVVSIYVTGLGQTDPPAQEGEVLTSTAPRLRAPVAVTIGGINADVLYAGVAPGFVTGVFQINARIPDAVPPGQMPVTLQAGGSTAASLVTVAVR
jgi:uncharacterized protein (TIGR03437 family)